MPNCQGYKYLLVIADLFSKWVEAYPTRREDAKTVVKCLMKEAIPRCGVPQEIDSDRGPAFVSEITQTLVTVLGFQRQLYVPYHPESSGQVERMNPIIREKLTKTMMTNWFKMG